ncbi:alkaline phosphatase family protein [Puniceicoccaceae bacterium K14]|nr:alkaline phosphatase family protein [Puniceicoccaceae bacterium K14]
MTTKTLLSIVCLLMQMQVTQLSAKDITRIAFGSCAKESKKQAIWEAIIEDRPDVFAMLGDNIYADTDDAEVIKTKYKSLAEKPGFKKIRKNTQIVATWDDHDYGQNDIGKAYPTKEASRRAFLEFFEEPKDSPRWTQEDGIYTAYEWDSQDHTVQFILLDTRWQRDDLDAVTEKEYFSERAPNNLGPYKPTQDTRRRMIGDEQWEWLEDQLRKPADLRIIASSIQLLPEFSGWESWANFPHERQRMFDTIKNANGVLFISGDTHWAEFSRVDFKDYYPLWELTSSGLTEEWKQVSPNKHRLGEYTHNANYGLIEIDWEAISPSVTLSIKNSDGNIQFQNTIRISDLKFCN